MSHWLRSSPRTSLDVGDLTLRRWEEADLGPLYDAATESLAELQPWMPWARDYDRSSARGFLDSVVDSWERRSDLLYAAVEADGTIVGSCGLHDRPGTGMLEIGYWIRTSRTGRGYATLAAAALTAEALRLDEVRSVEIHCDQTNERSARIPRRLGYELLERRPKEVQAPGESGIELVWLLRDRDLPGSPAARLAETGAL